MKKALVALLMLLVSIPSSAAASHRDRHALFPATWNRSGDAANPSTESKFLAANYSLIVLGFGTGQTRIDELYAAGSQMGAAVRAVRYMKSVGIHDPGDGSPSDAAFGWTTIVGPPDLRARLSYPGGTIIQNTFASPPWYYVDIFNQSSATARATWTAQLAALIANLQSTRATEGYYLDDTAVLLSSYTTSGLFPLGFSESAWYGAVGNIIASLRTSYPTSKAYANGYVGYPAAGHRGIEYLDNLDGIFAEGFSWKDDGTSTPPFWTPARYRQQVADGATALAWKGGRAFIMIDDYVSTDTTRRTFRLATYLLVSDGSGLLKEFSRVANTDSDLDYPLEFDGPVDQLGLPNSAVADSGTILSRTYTHGFVAVNPDTASHVVSLPTGTWSRLTMAGGTAWNDGTALMTWTSIGSSVTLAANTALVALNTAADNVPAATASAASGVTGAGAMLNGTVNPNGADTTVSFQYGLTTSYGSTAAYGSVGAGVVTLPVAVLVSGLTCGSTYHYRVVATNTNGTSNSSDQTVAAAACASDKPSALTLGATSISATGATLNGTVNPNGTATTPSFRYGTTASYGLTATASSAGSGVAAVSVSSSVSSLLCNRLYHFQVIATNSAGEGDGDDLTFTTAACPSPKPTVTTDPPTRIRKLFVALNGTANPNGVATTTGFQYGTSTSYGSATTYGSVGSGTAGVAFNRFLVGLTCGTTYHYRAMATNTNGTVFGVDRAFVPPCN